MKSKPRLDVIAIIISMVAVVFTGMQWWEAHEQGRLANDASVSFDIDADPSHNKFGIGIRNSGPGVARIESVKYFVDGKLIKNPYDAFQEAKLDVGRLHENELFGKPMAPGELIWIIQYELRKADSNAAGDFIVNHFRVGIYYCTAGGRCASDCSGWGGCGTAPMKLGDGRTG